MEWQHVYPVDDLKPHNTEGLICKCNPNIDWDNKIVIHNAWDLREAQELANTVTKSLNPIEVKMFNILVNRLITTFDGTISNVDRAVLGYMSKEDAEWFAFELSKLFNQYPKS